MNNWVGKTLGNVRIDSLLARGGMAEVYLGMHTNLHREVAVKILHNQHDENFSTLERFQREARVVAKLRHPNIVQVFDFDTVDNDPYLVMEYIQGPSLSKYLNTLHEKGRRMEIGAVLRLVNTIANALQYAHESGVIHRDVKPGNILLTSRTGQIVPGERLPDDFEPVLSDFGLVRFLDTKRQTSTSNAMIAGTPAYMSPEQARGDQTDERTDIYSLGIVLYELIAGRLPFDGESTVSILLKQISEPPPPIPGLSPAIQRVLNRALAKDKNKRFRTPMEFAETFSGAVDANLAHTTLELRKPLPVFPAPKTIQTKKNLQIFAALVGILAIIALGTVFVRNGSSIFTNESPTNLPITDTAINPAALPLGPTGVLHFQDESAIADQATLTAQAMPAPPKGYKYEVWLTGVEERLSLGILSLDSNGKGTLVFPDPQDLNLIARFDHVEITLEPNPDLDSASSGQVAYSFTQPAEGYVHVRYLLSSFPNAPQRIGLIQGLSWDSKIINETADKMLASLERGDNAGVRKKAESIMNLLAGSQSQDYKDWNKDGGLTDASDGYGLLLNGDNLGYIQAVYAEADYAANTPGATQKMIVNGEDVKICVQNLAQWIPQLQTQLSTILTSAPGTDLEQPVRAAAALAKQIADGTDLDGNGKIDPLVGEGGTQTAYEFAYYMADMPILPVGLTPTANALGTITIPTATSTLPRGSSTSTKTTEGIQQSTPTPQQTSAQPSSTQPVSTQPAPTQPPSTHAPPPRPTDKPKPTPKPTDEPKPTNEPKPTKEPKESNTPKP
jgi:serine/threonine protein kinase